MRETVETIELVSQNGERVRAKRITTYERGRTLDGGEIPTGSHTQLPDGTYLKGFIGDDQFLDESTGTFYKRA